MAAFQALVQGDTCHVQSTDDKHWHDNTILICSCAKRNAKRVYSCLNAILRKCAFKFKKYIFYPSLTVRRRMEVVRYIRNVKSGKRQIYERPISLLENIICNPKLDRIRCPDEVLPVYSSLFVVLKL